MIELLKLVNDYGGALALLGSVGTLLIATKFATREQVAETSKKVEAVEDRVSRIEGQLEHLPDREVTHRLEIGLTEIRGELAAMNEKFKPVAATMTRVQDFLMERK